MEVGVVGVYSLEDAEKLVSRRGDEEEVEVNVHKCMLRDVPQLREMLREQIQERHWGVVNLSRLREFVPIGEAVGTAAELLGGVSREPPHRIIEAAQARAQELQVVAGRLTEARMRWAQGLGRRLQILAAVMARGHKSPSVLLGQVVDARGRCRKVGERKISTVPVRRGANLVEQYMENLHKQ